MDKSLYKGIWVYAEQKDGVLSDTPLELLSKAVELKKVSGEEVTALLLGSGVRETAKELIAYGADRVIMADHPALRKYHTVPYAEAAKQIIEKHKPSIVLLGATAVGRDLAPRIMAKLGTGLTADCLDLDVDEDGILVQTKPSYGGNIMCTIVIPEHRPQMATVRPRVFSALEKNTQRTGDIICENIEICEDERVEILEITMKASSKDPIEKAEVIVAGGRGIKKKEELSMLAELAELIGARVGCSRPLVDEGWMTHEDQIGQSGNTVKARFIMNVGISGAVQYLVGMQNSKCILSINKNKAADIFDISSYGTVADYKELIPAVIAEIKKRKS